MPDEYLFYLWQNPKVFETLVTLCHYVLGNLGLAQVWLQEDLFNWRTMFFVQFQHTLKYFFFNLKSQNIYYLFLYFSFCFPSLIHTFLIPNIVFVLRPEVGYTVKYFPLTEGVPEGKARWELLKAKAYIWQYIQSWVLIRTLYHFNNH